MQPIVGRAFRAQERKRPWWVQALYALSGLLFIGYIVVMAWQAGMIAWSMYRRIPAAFQPGGGRLGALAFGMVLLTSACVRWRQKIYLAPAMRDLVTTPASPWRLLHLVLRFRLVSLMTLYVIGITLFLYWWYYIELAELGTEPGWAAVLPYIVPLTVFASLISAFILLALVDAIGVSAVLVIGALGLGGVTPRYPLLRGAWMLLRRPLLYGTMLTLGLMLFSMVIRSLPYTVPGVSDSQLVALGSVMVDLVNDRNAWPSKVIEYFPVVCWFDCVTMSIRGPQGDFSRAMLAMLGWLSASVLAGLIALRPGLSVAVRTGWFGAGDANGPTPADAAAKAPRGADTDAVTGPLDRWLIGRIGRMGRAILRLTTQDPSAGSLTSKLRQSLIPIAPTLAAAFALKTATPLAITALMHRFDIQAGSIDILIVTQIVTGFCIFIGFVSTINIWASRLVRVRSDRGTPFTRNVFHSVLEQDGVLLKNTVARGDFRYPLHEILAIGFKDAVLLSTFYTAGWLLVAVIVAGAEAFALELPRTAILYVCTAAYALIVQISFMGCLMLKHPYLLQDYRRQWFHNFLRGLAIAGVSLTIGGALFGLLAYLCEQTFDQGRLWVGIAGSINIVLIVDVVLYSVIRAIYIRRRYDCEIQTVRRGG